jgi:hypothetical protein
MKIPFFRISGIIIFFLSVLSLIIVKNLFIKFMATAVLLIFVYLAVYYIIVFVYYRKKKMEFASIEGKDLLPFKKVKIEITGMGFPAFFPGIFFSIKYDISENNTFHKKVSETISDIEPGKMIFFTSFDRHGKYILKNFKVVFQDIFGFSRYKIECNFDHELTVLPYFTDEIEIPYFTDEGGEQAIQNASKVSSTDFFENRKYYPGDDIRRLNWKVFAHINELHIREVEKIPPKVGEISLLFAPFSENLSEYEYISSIFFSTCYFLLKNNFELKILVPFSKNPVFIKSDNEREFGDIIFNSFKPFSHNSAEVLSSPIVFASFSEYSRLMNENIIGKHSYCKVSFAEIKESKSDLWKSIVRIDNFDNMIKEIADKMLKLKNKQVYEKKLESHLETGLTKDINTEVFRITYEQFENLK